MALIPTSNDSLPSQSNLCLPTVVHPTRGYRIPPRETCASGYSPTAFPPSLRWKGLGMELLVIIRCPRTGTEVPTGRMTTLNRLDNIPDRPVALACPACGDWHTWSRADAFLAHSLSGLDAPCLEPLAPARRLAS